MHRLTAKISAGRSLLHYPGLKTNELRQIGEVHSQRLLRQAWDRLFRGLVSCVLVLNSPSVIRGNQGLNCAAANAQPPPAGLYGLAFTDLS